MRSWPAKNPGWPRMVPRQPCTGVRDRHPAKSESVDHSKRARSRYPADVIRRLFGLVQRQAPCVEVSFSSPTGRFAVLNLGTGIEPTGTLTAERLQCRVATNSLIAR